MDWYEALLEHAWLLLGIPLALVLFQIQGHSLRAGLREARRKANAQFFAVQRPSELPGLGFNALQARILLDEERYGQGDAGFRYELTRYAANEAGEVFMFVYDPDGKPFVKHVEPRIAKVVLKDGYPPPLAQ